jgi:hypothetical protein
MDSFWSFINTPVSSGYPSPLVIGISLLVVGWGFAFFTTPYYKRDRMMGRTFKYAFVVALVGMLLLYLYYYQRRMRYVEGFDYINLPGEKDYTQFGNIWKGEDKQKVRHILALIWTDDRQSDGEVLDDETLLGWALNERKALPWDDNIVISSRNPRRLMERLNAHPDTIVNDDKIYIRNDYLNGKMWPYIRISARKDKDDEQEVNFENVKCNVPRCWRKVLQDKYGDKWDQYVETPKRCARTDYMVNPSMRVKRRASPIMSLYN